MYVYIYIYIIYIYIIYIYIYIYIICGITTLNENLKCPIKDKCIQRHDDERTPLSFMCFYTARSMLYPQSWPGSMAECFFKITVYLKHIIGLALNVKSCHVLRWNCILCLVLLQN